MEKDKGALEEIEDLRRYTKGGTREEAIIYNQAIADVIKILKKYELA